VSPTEAEPDLTAATRLFGRLLVRELDAATLTELREPAIADALEAVGVALPSAGQLPELASIYFELFLHPPDSLPPVQSLWRDGRFDTEPAAAVRRIAAAAGRELAGGARGAAPDHLGCILLLMAELRSTHPELVADLVQHHLAWGEHALRAAAARSDFYGAVTRATISLIHALRSAPL